jgi:serine acetyltransferase/GT2 family glycosyltransferase
MSPNESAAEARLPRLSVVIPTYERPERVAALVASLDAQTLPPSQFEVIVVDDGSRVDPRPALQATQHPFHLVLERTVNQGAGAARDRGVALARADVILFLDDDMIPGAALLEEHLRVHQGTPRAVVMGRLRSSRNVANMPIFERFHARKLEEFAEALRTSGRSPRGNELYSGNLSLRRADYLAVGGFDRSLGRSEDMELGYRLERAGAKILFSDAAFAEHDSDHASQEGWLASAFKYGVTDQRIARKHGDAPDVGPWRYLDYVSLVPRPGYALAIAAPQLGHVAVRGVMGLAETLDRLGLERPALAGTMLAYGMEYYRGVRSEAGSARACARDLRQYRARRRAELRTPRGRRRAAFERFVAAVRADHEMLLRSDAKYDTRGRKAASLSHELVERIGFQLLTAYRLMRLLNEGGAPLGAKVMGRLIRLVYGADIHWNAELAPGIGLNHGMGLAIGHAARIGRGVILSHNVSIGDGIDPKTRVAGQPTLEEDVHVGPGAVILGPYTIGARSKIMPNAVVMQSVPPDSIVEVPAVTIRPRRAHAANPLRSIGPSVPAPAAPAQANNPPAERSVA